MIFNEDAVQWSKNHKGEKFHALLTDAPYHLTSITERFGKKDSAPAKFGQDGVFQRSSKGFMGTTWDGGDVAFRVDTWEAFKEVLYPGAFGMAYSASRNWHRMAVAIEDAGFIIHPTMFFLWVQGQGFPKATRIKGNKVFDGHRYGLQALKPSIEPIIIFQKPYEGRPVDNMVETGAGTLNVDAARVPTNGNEVTINRFVDGAKPFGDGAGHEYETVTQQGRWPANFVIDWDSAAILDEQTGIHKSGVASGNSGAMGYHGGVRGSTEEIGYGDVGGASRFFNKVSTAIDETDPFLYCGKVMPKERSAGLNEKNNHPTLKPIELSKHLATLLLPPKEYSPRRVFVPFSGSGSEMIGCYLAGWEEVVGVEFDTENGYVDIAKKRIQYWTERDG